MSRPLLIWGCGGHGREVLDLCRQIGVDVVGFLDERPEMRGAVVDDVQVIGNIQDALPSCDQADVLCAGVGDPVLKRRFLLQSQELGFRISPPLIHPAARIGTSCEVGPGSIITDGCILTINIRIGAHVVINRATTIGHDCRIGDFCTVSPMCALSGNVTMGEGVYLGTHSAVREKLTIGKWSIVGGGAFVIGDIPDRCMYAGVPAVKKRDLH